MRLILLYISSLVQQLAGGAASGAQIIRNLLQIRSDLVGVVVKRLVVDELARRTFAGLDLARQLFSLANRRVQVVVKRLVVEQTPDGAFAFVHVLHDFVQLIG